MLSWRTAVLGFRSYSFTPTHCKTHKHTHTHVQVFTQPTHHGPFIWSYGFCNVLSICIDSCICFFVDVNFFTVLTVTCTRVGNNQVVFIHSYIWMICICINAVVVLLLISVCTLKVISVNRFLLKYQTNCFNTIDCRSSPANPCVMILVFPGCPQGEELSCPLTASTVVYLFPF